jgi:RNA polymerase sigma factor (sigma-70 family)
MSTATLGGFLARLQDALASGDLASCPDGELLERFLATRDEAAFTALLRRHGPMVYRVCRRVLPVEQDAEDAFQATFLVLAGKAGTVRKRPSLASWLHGVAYRIALEALDEAVRHRRHEARAGQAARPAPAADDVTWKEVRAVLDEELARLPGRLQGPLVLCLLEGQTQDEAARQLGLSLSTCRRDLERGRALLAAGLSRRGLSLSAALLPPLLSTGVAEARLPALLVRTAKAFRLGGLSGRVAGLTERAVRTMGMKTWVMTVAVALACVGGAGVAYRGLSAEEPPARAAKQPAAPARPGVQRKLDPRLNKALALALEDTEAIKEPFDRVATYCSIARLQARTGQRKAAADVLRKALEAEDREQGPNAMMHKDNRLWVIAECQAETGDDKGALETIKAGISELNTNHALCQVAVALVRSGKVKRGLEVADQIRGGARADLLKNEALRGIAVTLAEARDVKGAVATAGRIRSGTANRALALAAVAIAQARGGDRDGAAKHLAAASEAADLAEHKVFALTKVAEALATVGKTADARKTIAKIPAGQGQDDARQVVATALAGRGDVKAARETAEAIEDGYLKGEAQKAIVTALIRARDLAGARKATGAISDDMGRCYALMELARGQAASGKKTAARQALKDALELADRLGDSRRFRGVREAALAHVAGIRATAGEAEAALEWAGKQTDPCVRAMARVRVAEALVQVPGK